MSKTHPPKGPGRTVPPAPRVVYIALDDTLCDLAGGLAAAWAASPEIDPQRLMGFFLELPPIPGAVEAYGLLSQRPNTEVYILATPSVQHPMSYTEKRLWVEVHLGLATAHRLIFCSNTALLIGDVLIDRHASGRGQESFSGELIQWGSGHHPDWDSVLFHPAFNPFND